jgi:murein DD-endopeptidase MepM/ murein hydrolase activator NlpD
MLRLLTWTLFVLALTVAPPAMALEMRVVPLSPGQGGIVTFFLSGVRGAREVEGKLGDRPLRFFRDGDQYAALAGIDVEAKPGKVPWRVSVVDALGASRERTGEIVVKSREFPVQRLTLPTPMVDLDAEAERRVASEAARLRALSQTVSPERLWHGPFARPVAGLDPGQGFGARRIINGKPRMPHSGVDFGVERGTPVVASNRGRVALVGDFFFAGRLVVLDHGLGLYTLYFHLDRIDVPEGAMLERGEQIGVVGATGRATGPHLHWAAQLGSSRIDALALLSVPVSD